MTTKRVPPVDARRDASPSGFRRGPLGPVPVLLLALGAAACGGDDGTEPVLRPALEFASPRLELGDDRRGSVELANSGGAVAGPVLVIPGPVTDAGGAGVTDARAEADPPRIEELAPGETVPVAVELELDRPLPEGDYAVDLSAVVGGEAGDTLAVTFRVGAASGGGVARVSIVGDVEEPRQGDVVRFRAEARAADGTLLADAGTRWRLEPASAGRLDDRGRFVGYVPGEARVLARVDSAADTLPVRIRPRGVEGSLTFLAGAGPPRRNSSDLRVHGDHAYTGSRGGGSGGVPPGNTLFTWRVSDPSNPVMTDSLKVDAGTVNDVKIAADGGLAVITHEASADGKNGVTLLDLADPAHPRVVTRYTAGLEGGVHNVWIDGDHLYVAADGSGNGLHVVDISDPTHPSTVGRFVADRSFLHDVHVRDGLAFLSYWNAGLIVLDVGNGISGGSPANPVEVSRIRTAGGQTHNAWYWPGGGYVFVGEEDFVTNGVVHVVDFRNPTDPREVATFAVPGETPHNFWLDEEAEVLYAAWYTKGLRAVDVSGELLGELERQGREIASLQYAGAGGSCPGTGTCSWGPQLHRGTVFVSDMNRGIVAVRPGL